MTHCCNHSQTVSATGATKVQLSLVRIEAMDCLTEQSLIEQRLNGLAEVERLAFNLLKRELKVWHHFGDNQPLLDELAALGMQGQLVTGFSTSSWRIEQMDCPTEEQLIRSALEALPEVSELSFNLLQRQLTVEHSAGAEALIVEHLTRLGFTAQPSSADSDAVGLQEAKAKGWWPLLVAGLFALGAEVLHFVGVEPAWLGALSAVAAILICGLGTYKKGWIALKNRNLNINALMSIAVTGAALIGQWPEAAMVMVLFTLAERIEARSLGRARDAIADLLQLAPQTALVQQADGSWAEQAVAQVALATRVRVRPGERIALDGEVLEGHSTVNQAPITGESVSVEKGPGDAVFAGTINDAAELQIKVTALAQDSTLARIIQVVQDAQGSKAPTQRFVDQFSRIYTPLVFISAVLVALFGPLLLGGLWLDWVYRALVLLVVACPCALVISTPVTVVSGLAAAARKGILIKGGVYLENGRHLRQLALDKTGTLTQGKPQLTDRISLVPEQAQLHWQWAVSLAERSDHPVSKAIAQQAAADAWPRVEVQAFSALLGRGSQGQVEGQTLYLANPRLLAELGLLSAALTEQMTVLEQQGKTVLALASPQQVLMLLAVADQLRETSREAVAQLQQLGITCVMLSGDNLASAKAIAEQAGLDQVQAPLLPEDKLAWVKQQQMAGRVVGMVGDGINDAPALAQADIGFAMGAAGTDTAIETADVALMDDDLRKLPSFVRLSQATARLLKQNIVLALGIKAVFLALTFAGLATMWMAVFADLGVSLLVVFNGLRLLRY